MQDSKSDYYFFTMCSATMLGDPGNDKTSLCWMINRERNDDLAMP